MAVYICLVAIIFIFGILLSPYYSKLKRKTYLMIVFISLFLVSGFRAYTVGADTNNYVSMFNSTEYIGVLNTRIEMGFMTYLKLLHRFSDDPSILLIVTSFICIGAVCLFAYKYSKDPMMSLLLYVLMGSYFAQMNTMRQSLAMSIGAVAYMLVLSDKGGYCKRSLQVSSYSLHQQFIQSHSYCLFHMRS